MTDREKVIKGLKFCSEIKEKCDDCPYSGVLRCMMVLKRDALELLKAQESVKPFVTGNGHTLEEAETWWYECGNCNEPIDPNDQYCRHCGRAVKWDG
jgi:hypothetical protein